MTSTANELSPLDILLGVGAGAAVKAELDAEAAERARFDRGLATRPACYPESGAKCPRCNGRGVIDCFRHVANGSCFSCEGWGVVRGG